MTHFPSQRSPRPAVAPAAVPGPPAGLCPGAVGEAAGEPHLNPDAERASIPRNPSGRTDEWGAACEPPDFPARRPDPPAAVPALVTRLPGPRKQTGDAVAPHVPDRVEGADVWASYARTAH
ncbi:hypothetical protein [Streptomyces sp. NPDC058291]|uniref:hypothetical protein n=1 Tax=Streptomyces sp. NPDC058291 TaxID=3346427 RepID=UPI0036E934FB